MKNSYSLILESCRLKRNTKEKFGTSLSKEKIVKLVDSELDFYSEDLTEDEINIYKEKIQKILFHEKDRFIGSHTSIVLKENQDWIKDRKSNENFDDYYYDRYESYISKKFDMATISENDEVTDFILNNLGDPLQRNSFSSRGLVVGSVQSGKTLNFTGLINKAADHGYKFIVVLTGIHNILREQTQERIDDGFIGMTTGGNIGFVHSNKKSGVGKIAFTPEKKPFPLTTFDYDFNKIKSESGSNLEQIKSPVIAVIKKNKAVLESLIKWIDSEHDVDLDNQIRMDSPILIIDDEADNASVNTSEKKVTTINNLIKELLNRFNKKAYVGYTATPFANIFIKTTQNDESIESDDLFPRNFITKLDFPTNYVGPDNFFGSDEKRNDNLVNYFSDNEQNRHLIIDKDNDCFEVTSLSEELKKAIRNYILVLACRNHRNDGDGHNSMLINFHYRTLLIKSMKSHISEYVHDIKKALKAFGSLPLEQGRKNTLINDIYETYRDEFLNKNIKDSYQDIQKFLYKSVAKIDILAIHNKGDSIVYDKDGSKYIIAIGGYSLGRGFTLEGLSVTFLSRQTATMDTLLQMGRWFGYRDGYDDICRLYLNVGSYANYIDTVTSLNELYDMLLVMKAKNKTPLNFGLAVREHPGGIKVTAANKRRSAKSSVRYISFRGTKYQASRLSLDEKNREINYNSVINLFSELKSSNNPLPISGYDNNIYFKNISIETISKFVNKFIEPETFANQEGYLRKYLDQNHEDMKDNWKVVFLSRVQSSPDLTGEEAKISIDLDADISLKPNARTVTTKREEMGGSKLENVATIGNSQIGNSQEELLTLDHQLKEKINKEFELLKTNGHVTAKTFGPRFIREYTSEPVIFIYPIILMKKKDKKDKKESEEKKLYLKSKMGVDFTFSIAFPPSDQEDKKKITMLENEISQRYRQSQLFDEDEDNAELQSLEEED